MTVGQKINRERVTVLGWGRAILLQFAHPLIAAGIAEHSGFDQGPLSRLHRLQATVGAMRQLTFGDERQVARTAARINAIHDRVNGRLGTAAAGLAAGTPYTATDPALLLWVHATMVESVGLAYERFVGPLSRAEKDALCAESIDVASRLRIPDHLVPGSGAALDEYMSQVRDSGRLEVTETAKRLARGILFPPLLDPTRPGAWLTRLVTAGLLPPDICRAYGLPWTPGRQRLLDIVAASFRCLLPITPPPVRFWPEGRR
jgi:uncharacterized protein (DUF2236 family)